MYRRIENGFGLEDKNAATSIVPFKTKVSRQLLDCYLVDPAKIEYSPDVNALLEITIKQAGYSCHSNGQIHQFDPKGVTAAFVLSDEKGPQLRFPGGHITIHTWPEYGSAAIDVVTPESDQILLNAVIAAFAPKNIVKQEYNRPNTFQRCRYVPRTNNMHLGRESVSQFKGTRNLESCILTPDKTVDFLRGIAKDAGFKVVNSRAYIFPLSNAVCGMLVLEESHFAFHYSAEYDEGHIDIYTCGTEGDPNKGISGLLNRISPQIHLEQKNIPRLLPPNF